MTTSAVIHRRINELEYTTRDTMPYQSLLRKLQDRYDKERNSEKRLEMETQIVLLLGIIDIQKGITKIVQVFEKMAERE